MTAKVIQGIDIGFIRPEKTPTYDPTNTPPPGYERNPHRRFVTVYFPDGSYEVVNGDCPTDLERGIVEAAHAKWQDHVWAERLVEIDGIGQ